MMNYEIFKEVVGEKFMDYMADEYKNLTLDIREVKKVNVKLDSLSVREEGNSISPTIYINDMYKEYQKTNDLETVIKQSASQMSELIKNAPKELNNLNVENIKENLIFQFVNTEQNKELLSTIPHREFNDLSIVYRWVVSANEKGIQSTIISNDLAEKFDFKEEILFNLAKENTKRINPPVIKSMNDVIKEMFIKDGMPEEIASMMISEDSPMWVITNEMKLNGAISMIYDEEINKLSEKLDSNLYILPSSIHEVIAVPTTMGEPNNLSEMVEEINMDQVALDERLSNQVYHYDRQTREITVATNNARQISGEITYDAIQRKGR